MPYLYDTPHSSGHGSLAAAVGAVIADLEAGRHYLYEGDDITSEELGTRLLAIVAAYEIKGVQPEPINFSRSTGAAGAREFHIAPRHGKFVVTEATEADRDVTVDESGESWPDGTPIAENVFDRLLPQHA